MRLFQYLKTLPFPCQHDFFIKLILKRLVVMEALAAIKFKKLPVEDLQRELVIMTDLKKRCREQGYSAMKTGIIINIILDNIQLAKCIQKACFNEWEALSKQYLGDVALNSAQKIISEQITHFTLLQSLREYINQTTNELFEAIHHVSKITNMSELIDPLINCYPYIDQIELNKIIIDLRKDLEKFISI